METSNSGPKAQILIYGAYGSVGRDAVRWIAARGPEAVSRFVLAGRRHDPLKALADQHGFEFRVFTLDELGDVETQLRHVAAVLLLAGPFDVTAPAMLEACLRTGTHYLDISGEKSVSRMLLEERRSEIEQAGIVVMPSVAFDTVAFDCLAATLARQLPDADTLELGFAVTTTAKPSAGTLKTMLNMAEAGEFSAARVEGQLVVPPSGRKRLTVSLPNIGPTPMMFSSLTDVYTAFFSTGIENIYTYVPVDVARITGTMTALTRIPGAKRAMQRLADWLMPASSDRDGVPMTANIWGRVSGGGSERVAWATVADAKQYTAVASVRSAERLMDQRDVLAPGSYTPSMAFGAGFAFELPGAKLLSTCERM